MTPYSKSNQAFSDAAHLAARQHIYPNLFVPLQSKEGAITYISPAFGNSKKERVLDGDMGIDRLVRIACNDFSAPLEFTIQERFRRPEYATWNDLTVTEWNHQTNLPSELHKINAGIFVYGYFNPKRGDFVNWVAADTMRLIYAVSIGQLKYKRFENERSGQTFVSFAFDDLRQSEVIFKEMKDRCIFGQISK